MLSLALALKIGRDPRWKWIVDQTLVVIADENTRICARGIRDLGN